ncbi:MAG: L,D-transpeptidase family protein [bacterium]|nr:L,D-transpeptidase family protein [bacterium]
MKNLVIIVAILFIALPVFASEIIDTDNDGLSDEQEINIYKTDPQKADTDSDGYNDGEEVKNNYSPLNPKKVKIKDNDYDNDGLSDEMEIKFKTDLTNPDTDGDGYKDGAEIAKGYNPLDSKLKAKLIKKIEINLKQQKLSYFLSDVKLGEFLVSSGKNNSTPKGNFKTSNKSIKAWSSYGLWMPYWIGIENQKFGIHELPVWPNGYREGQNHLGTPVSHGCIRLGIGSAKIIYDWVEKGTPVIIN